MALRAVCRKARRHVIGIRRALEIRHVAAHARRVGQIVITVHVTIGALPRRHCVQARQREVGHRVVIELRVQPVVGGVAGIASYGEPGADVVGVVRFAVVGLVARVTRDRHRLKPALRRSLVAGVAIHRRVSSSEREAIIVILDLLYRDRPSSHGVALLTVGSQLPPVNIGVAILATLPDAAEYWLHVTLGAVHRLVHAAKGIPGLIVIELGDSTDWLPSARRVAILTSDVQISVRAMCARSLSLRRHTPRSPGQRQYHN